MFFCRAEFVGAGLVARGQGVSVASPNKLELPVADEDVAVFAFETWPLNTATLEVKVWASTRVH